MSRNRHRIHESPKALKPGKRVYRYGGYLVEVVVRAEELDHEDIRMVRINKRPVPALRACRNYPSLPVRYRERLRKEAERLEAERARQQRLAEQGIEVVEAKVKPQKVEPATWSDLRSAAAATA